ncbi:hypothetical protein Acsp06_59590 [Actinomycetospora sp. NBRC 106375]|uniref:DUF202 domain-containing protein n=1 Tax=Actinomycetospora sp. NBRC 106375 TaxID=3032207 RepID=UPI0024A5E0DB|nr:DUF202 domain-containing protein [Actinomycetospora sp. NBRC 106375]GLZ49774.1 hypothetical protein Acsp06_59590 [Actinomycetospora sp. NBRC 106375]
MTGPEDMDPRQRRLRSRPGLQPERTALSWDRTALAMLANGALLIFRENRTGSVLAWVPAGLALLAALICALLGRRRHARIVGSGARTISAATGEAVSLTAMVAALGVLTLLLTLPEV